MISVVLACIFAEQGKVVFVFASGPERILLLITALSSVKVQHHYTICNSVKYSIAKNLSLE